jgi:hypothetical protein
MRPAAGRLAWPDAVGPLHERQPLLDGVPEVGVDDPKFWMLLPNPLLGRSRERPAAPRIGVLDEPSLVPDPDAGILFVPQDDADR